MLGEPPHGLGSHLLQETYLGQLRTMQAWVVLLFWTLLRATGGFSSYGYIQTEEYKTKYLKDLATVEDGNEKQLISDLHQVLERLQSIQFPALRKKHGYLPVCEPGEQCALRKGSRIGKLCDCSLPRTCNSFLHRCF
ncbi:cocaine- and amphetamine-regulated transcript ch9 [Oryzias latipes]|uniref:Cocaine-and amphetamine-regulated transcript ch9 n=1 Tax=Oryzias latipes TaxID=8090 RepID=E3WET8_ORYLA|nr:cocaine- and amphetamine-regulated transcript ch9 [Oryzias latipes]BAJ39824.1 cocaine- and amphetamine-regulated transcript ch9 [Oryzias latipes]